MLYSRQFLTILLFAIITRSFSQEMPHEKLRTGDNYYNISQNADLAFRNDFNGEPFTDQSTDKLLNNSAKSGSGEEIADGNETAVPIEFLGPEFDTKFKRGNMIEVRWTGGNPDDEYALDLFDGRFHYRHIGELKNSGIYPWIIPMDVAPGKEYKFKLTNTEDFGEYAFSESFIIKRRMPVAAWIVPGAIVVGGGLFLLIYDSSNELPDLPRPIEPK